MKRSLLPRAARIGVIIQMRAAEQRSILGLKGVLFLWSFEALWVFRIETRICVIFSTVIIQHSYYFYFCSLYSPIIHDPCTKPMGPLYT